MPIISTTAEFYVSAPNPEDGGAIFRLEVPIQGGVLVPQPTDAELIDLGNAIVASDYIQNRAWTGGASLISINVPAGRTVYP